MTSLFPNGRDHETDTMDRQRVTQSWLFVPLIRAALGVDGDTHLYDAQRFVPQDFLVCFSKTCCCERHAQIMAGLERRPSRPEGLEFTLAKPRAPGKRGASSQTAERIHRLRTQPRESNASVAREGWQAANEESKRKNILKGQGSRNHTHMPPRASQ